MKKFGNPTSVTNLINAAKNKKTSTQRKLYPIVGVHKKLKSVFTVESNSRGVIRAVCRSSDDPEYIGTELVLTAASFVMNAQSDFRFKDHPPGSVLTVVHNEDERSSHIPKIF